MRTLTTYFEDSISLIILSITTLMIVVTVIYNLTQIISKAKCNIPFVPGGLPFFGQVFTLLKGSPWDTFAKWALEFGLVFRIHLFGSWMIVVADPSILKVMLSTKLSIFKKDLDWTYKPFLTILGNGLVTSDGVSHRQQRTLLASHFRTDILDDIPTMALEAFQRLSIKLDHAQQSKSIVEMSEEFRHLTLQVIAEAILSLPPQESDETFAHMYLPIVEEGNKRTWSPERAYLPNESWLVFGPAVKRLNDYVTNLIIKRRNLKLEEKKNGNNNHSTTATTTTSTTTTTTTTSTTSTTNAHGHRKQDVLDIRIDSIPDDEWNDNAIKQIRDEVKTFILAGHETSASMLTWALLELSKNPKLRDELRQEGRKIFHGHLSDDSKNIISLPNMDKLNELKFAEACLRESLRRYSVVPSVARVSAEDITIGEYYIPKGSNIILNIQGVHHNPQYWPEPMKYDPHRFLGGQEIQPYTFLPFIEGPRMCIGQFLSLLETKIVLTALLLKYDFTIQNNNEANEKHAYMIPIIPKTGHYMKISPSSS